VHLATPYNPSSSKLNVPRTVGIIALRQAQCSSHVANNHQLVHHLTLGLTPRLPCFGKGIKISKAISTSSLSVSNNFKLGLLCFSFAPYKLYFLKIQARMRYRLEYTRFICTIHQRMKLRPTQNLHQDTFKILVRSQVDIDQVLDS